MRASKATAEGRLTNCSSQPLAVAMSRFHMTSTLNSAAKLGSLQRWLSSVSLARFRST
jgi:hypothetical protein